MAFPRCSENLTCLVTGASSGIGGEIARELGRRGYGVTLVARREDRLRALADELADAHDVRAEVIAADLTEVAERRRIADTVAERGLHVGVLVNNAGLSTFGPVQRSEPDREVTMIRTDVEAVVDLCSRFIPGMVEQGTGAVLNVASTAAFQPLPGQAGYAAAKAFVLSYSYAIRAELRGTGVGVTALCPGPVHTEFGAVAGMDMDNLGEPLPKFMWVDVDKVAKAAVAGLVKATPMVIPGWANRATAYLAPVVPRRLLTAVIARQHPALNR